MREGPPRQRLEQIVDVAVAEGGDHRRLRPQVRVPRPRHRDEDPIAVLDERVLPSTGRVQREGEHPGRRAQGHRERDRPAHREPRDVRRLEPERVHHLERVGGHVLHRVPGGRDLAPSDPPVVEGEAAEVLAVDRDLLGLRCATLILSAFRPQSCHLATDRQFPDVVGVVISGD